MNRDVVVTGIGVLSPVGTGKEDFWNALKEGRSGFKEISLFDTTRYRTNIGGEIAGFDPVEYLGKKGLRTLDRSTKLVCSAARLALDDAGLDITPENEGSIGVSVGSTFGSLKSIAEFDREGITEGPRYVNPSYFPNTVLNSPASNISIRFGIKGFNTTVSTGFCASLDAIMYASDFIRLNRADAVLAGGVEELCNETFLIFNELGYLSSSNEDSLSVDAPAVNGGLVLSEGSALCVLESEEHALKRSASILARVAGYGNSFDPSINNGGQSGLGLSRAIINALKEAGLDKNDIDLICCGVTATKSMIRTEFDLITDMFGDQTKIRSIDPSIRGSFSASGAMALSYGIGLITGTDGNHPSVDTSSSDRNIHRVMVIASDPRGNNSAVVLERFEDE
ncbi:MAG: beta-ketoacyl-[acyl-carrier-protein] synthase family protein [Nitrospirota bacterium]|nr:MAG: beta-ketoacyl-[acyl-carrier-protein] synthase family protein [Nitrospirota bacterium]